MTVLGIHVWSEWFALAVPTYSGVLPTAGMTCQALSGVHLPPL